MADTFVVHLAGGMYLDSSGNIVIGPPEGAQIYNTPEGFNLDLDGVKDAFKFLSEILPYDEEGKKKWTKWGVNPEVVDFLSKISGVVGVVATAVSIYAFSIGVMVKLIGLISDDGGLTPAMAKAFDNISRQLRGMEQTQIAENMARLLGAFKGKAATMNGLAVTLQTEGSASPNKKQIVSDMVQLVDDLSVPLYQTINQPWTVAAQPDNYKALAFASPVLFIPRSDGTMQWVGDKPQELTMFDYRLGVPMLIYAATAYAGMLQVAMPWFRSSSMYVQQLKDTAIAIDNFVMNMQNKVLSRTEFNYDSLFREQHMPIMDIIGDIGRSELAFQYAQPYLAVGAFDLVVYNDAFISQKWQEAFVAQIDTGPRGLFNFRWYYPQNVTPEEIIAAANAKARSDYANMQAATGMFKLISVSSWLKFLSTLPDHSQTVTGYTGDRRIQLSHASITVSSPIIPTAGVIESSATLRTYNASAKIGITTQEPGYTPAFRYRVLLRTIASAGQSGSWQHYDYHGDVWKTEYVPDENDPRFNRLKTSFNDGMELSEVLLWESRSPDDTVHVKGHEKIKATTFDWFVPVNMPDFSFSPEAVNKPAYTLEFQKKMNTGGMSIHLMDTFIPHPPGPPSPGPAPLKKAYSDSFDMDEMITLNDYSLDKAERRNCKYEEVQIDWELLWSGSKLIVRIKGYPEDRPFQIYVVVEEIVYPGLNLPAESIHTSFQAEIVNKLITVPVVFFEKEKKALAEAAKKWREFQQKYAVDTPIGPGDPIEFLGKSIKEITQYSASTITIAETLQMQETFALTHAPQLWKTLQSQENPNGGSAGTHPLSGV